MEYCEGTKMTIKGTKIPIGQEWVFLGHQIGHVQSVFLHKISIFD
jgi:hypothetical protein